MAKAKFQYRAVSPFTGREFTRSSNRVYTHVVVSGGTAGDELRKQDGNLAYYNGQLALYNALSEALALESGEPAQGSPSHWKVTSASYLEQQAGVRTHWQQALYQLQHGSPYAEEQGPMSRALLAARYASYAAGTAKRIAETRARIAELEAMDAGAVLDESISFAGRADLAAKAGTALYGSRKAVVAVEVVS